MERFIAGDVVVIPFPYSDLTGAKNRPALVIAQANNRDLILRQITSKANKDQQAVFLDSIGFATGRLPIVSYIRPNKLFTADKLIIIRKAGSVNPAVLKETIKQISKIINAG